MLMQISTIDHMNMSLPSRRHVSISPLEYQASGILKGERDLQGEREISRGREYLSRKYFSRIPDAWCSIGEMPTYLLEGRDMFI